jgi:hypothetical protein
LVLRDFSVDGYIAPFGGAPQEFHITGVFLPPSVTPDGITFQDFVDGPNANLVLDNVRVIPEPMMGSLFLLGSAAALAVRCLRKGPRADYIRFTLQ